MVQSTSLATAARYEEDAPAASGDYGTLILGVRNDAGGTLVNANGDYAPLQFNNLGELIIGGPGGVFTVVVVQPVHDLLNCNANIQVGDVDVNDANPVPVSDAGGSLTIDNAILSVVGGGVEATAQRVTIANDSTGLLSVDDNGASLTVDNPILSVVGGGAEAAAQRVTIANDSTGLLSVDDGGGALTVDNTVLSVVGGGAEATAQRVTIANDSTGVLSVDDNGGSLTVDDGGTALTVDITNNVEITFDHGSNSAIGVAATRFIVAATPAVLGVEVKAANANTANIYIGNADVTAATVDATDGMELGPGESILVRIDDVNKLYAIAPAGTQRVFWLRV